MPDKSGFPTIHRGTSSGSSASSAAVANYLHTTGTGIFDSTNTAFLPRSAQWVGFNNTGVGFNYTPPFTESRANPATFHGDAYQAASVYKLNTVRLAISWHMVERIAPTLISPGLYKHEWTDNSGVIDMSWDTAPDNTTGLGYLAALQECISDLRAQGLRVILELQQSQWSPGCDPVNGAGFPAWLYATPTPGATTSSQEVSAAKWEFFQAGGGWARPGIAGPPQDLLKDFWKLIMLHFQNDDTVVGIDFINEPGWPTSHPVPGSPSAIANPSAPTDTSLVACYQVLINLAASIQSHWLRIYENGTYANKTAGRSPLTSSTTPPTGSNLVMSWHYYPENPNAGDGNGVSAPLTPGTAPTLTQVNTFKTYLSDMVTLAQTTFGHAFWVGETSMFHHIEQKFTNRAFDYPDTVYSSTYSLWEKLTRDFMSAATAGNYGWSIWAFQGGAGRSMLDNTTGVPKTDYLSAIGATPDPPPVADLGPATAITWAAVPNPADATQVGPSTYSSADDQWVSQRWIDLYYDRGIFGRGTAVNARTTPTQVLASTDVTITSDGTLAGTTITGTTFGTGFVKSGIDGAVVVTCDAQANSLTVTGPATPSQLLLTGKVWVVNKNGDLTQTPDAFNNSFNNADPGGFILLTSCAVALSRFYQFCPSGKDAAIRLVGTVAKDNVTPYFDGFLCEGVTRDWCKPGGGTADFWFRHGTVAAHPYAWIMTNPTSIAVPLALRLSLGAPVPYDGGSTYHLYDTVSTGGHKYYCRIEGTHGVSPPSELGGANANWEFYGDLHSDGIQVFRAVNTQARAVCENVFFYQMNHSCMYVELGYKVAGGNATLNKGQWAGGTPYTTGQIVRDSTGREWIALQDSTGQDPTTPSSTYWQYASGHNLYLQWCLCLANAEVVPNGPEDPSNGAKNCIIASGLDPGASPPYSLLADRDPIQGIKPTNNADGSNTTWTAGEVHGITNKLNVWAGDTDNAAGTYPAGGSAIPGSTTS